MKTLEEILIEQGEEPLKNLYDSEKILLFLESTIKRRQIRLEIMYELSGNDMLDLIYNLEDKDLIDMLLKRKFKLKLDYNNVRWKITLLLIIVVGTVIIISALRTAGFEFLSSEEKETIVDLIKALLEFLQNVSSNDVEATN